LIAIRSAQFALLRPRGDDPDCMDDPGDVPKDRQQNVEPEMQTQADREKDAHGRQQDGQNDTDDIHNMSPQRAASIARPGTNPTKLIDVPNVAASGRA
jgi:hypothetical protein